MKKAWKVCIFSLFMFAVTLPCSGYDQYQHGEDTEKTLAIMDAKTPCSLWARHYLPSTEPSTGNNIEFFAETSSGDYYIGSPFYYFGGNLYRSIFMEFDMDYTWHLRLG